MDSEMIYLNMELIDNMGTAKGSNQSPKANQSFGSLISLESPKSSGPEKRSAELEDTLRPEKKQRLGRKTKNTGLRAERNRQSAAASRERSKRHLQELERLSHTLPDVNARLAANNGKAQQHSAKAKTLRAENALLNAKIEMQQTRLSSMESKDDKYRSLAWLL